MQKPSAASWAGSIALPSRRRLQEISVRKDVKAGSKTFVLLGAGGSSLCPEVLKQSLRRRPGHARLRALTPPTAPGPSAATREPGGRLKRETLFIVAVKSGSTIVVSHASSSNISGAASEPPAKSPGAQFISGIADPKPPAGPRPERGVPVKSATEPRTGRRCPFRR